MPTDQYDAWGWYTDEVTGRSAGVEPASIPAQRVVGQPYPNWTGSEWKMVPYVAPLVVAPAEPPAAPEPEWAWYIDTGPFTDRLGAASAAIDTSTLPGLAAIRSDFARRKWIDLKDPRVIGAVWYLAGQTHPVLGTLSQPLISAEVAAAALATKPVPAENFALRKLYFS